MSRKIEPDIRSMTMSQLRRELANVRFAIRRHKIATHNARCYHNDLDLYNKTLPEGEQGAGIMHDRARFYVQNCLSYIKGQKCVDRECRGLVIKKVFPQNCCTNCLASGYDGISCGQCGYGPSLGAM